MKLSVNLNGEGNVAAEKTGNAGEMRLNDVLVKYELIEKAPNHYTYVVEGRTIDLFVLKFDRENKRAVLIVNGKKCTVEGTTEMDLLLKKLGMDSGGARKVKELKAPMPGMVLKVEIAAGTEVKKDQPLVILEAMKMENVLKAAADGVVQSVEVKTGQAVEKGQVLIKFN